MATPKSGIKRKAISIDTKIEVISAVDAGILTKSKIAEKFDLKRNTLSTILKNRDAILNSYDSDILSPARKKLRFGKYDDIEEALLKWFRGARSEHIALSGEILREKANEFAKLLGHPEFSASLGFIDRFKKRHNIVSRRICGESAAVDTEKTEFYKTNTLPKILEDYEPKNVFNADETGLFYRLLPDKTLQFKGEKCHGGKKGKERITVMTAANMDGTEKLKLLVIGKFQKPRCFKGIQSLPVEYDFNRKSWMTSELFIKWVRSLDKKMARERRRIVLFIDNCPAHPKITDLKNIRQEFFPPNCTSVLQPMDQGVIRCLKQLYRRNLITYLLRCYDTKQNPVIDLRIGINFISSAWNMLSGTTIANCYRNAGFVEQEQEDPDDDVPLADLIQEGIPLSALRDSWQKLKDGNKIPDGVSLEDYTEIDNEITTRSYPSEDEIVSEIKGPEKGSDDENETDTDEIIVAKPVSVSDFFSSLDVIRRFLEVNRSSEKLFNHCSELEEFGIKEQCNSKIQPKITSFFK